MVELNPAFPTFQRSDLSDSPEEIVKALLEIGVCYISGYEDYLPKVSNDFDALDLKSDGSVKVLSVKESKVDFPNIYSILFAEEFKDIKKKVLGSFYKDEIEIFCQHTGPSDAPASGILHFDKRYTFKSWYYLNDIGPSEGPMRVVPLNRCTEHSPVKLREEIGTRNLFHGSITQHHASEKTLELLESSSEFVTGPKGTLFLHITESWHGASPVMEGSERMIIRGHSRAFSDHFVK